MHLRILLILCFLSFSSISFSQSRRDTPRYGEGIYAFLERNKLSRSVHYEEFLSLNKGRFGKDNSLIMGRSYRLPTSTSGSSNAQASSAQTTTGQKKVNALYGKNYRNLTIKSNKLKGATFFLSSGHGGPDPGSITKIDGHDIHEDEYAYDITLRLARILEEEGATVYMIIQDANDGIRDDIYLKNSKTETCMGKPIPAGERARLKQRSDKINELYNSSNDRYKRGVFIHLDSRSKAQQLDVFFYFAPNSSGGQKLANTMRQTFNEQYKQHQPSRGFSGTVSSRDLYVLSNTIPVGLFIELGNIQNTYDRQRFLNPSNRQALAKWIAIGLTKDYQASR